MLLKTSHQTSFFRVWDGMLNFTVHYAAGAYMRTKPASSPLQSPYNAWLSPCENSAANCLEDFQWENSRVGILSCLSLALPRQHPGPNWAVVPLERTTSRLDSHNIIQCQVHQVHVWKQLYSHASSINLWVQLLTIRANERISHFLMLIWVGAQTSSFSSSERPFQPRWES